MQKSKSPQQASTCNFKYFNINYGFLVSHLSNTLYWPAYKLCSLYLACLRWIQIGTKSLLLSSSTKMDSVTSRLKNNWELFPLHIWKQHQQYLMTESYCTCFNCYLLSYFHVLLVHMMFSLKSQSFLTVYEFHVKILSSSLKKRVSLKKPLNRTN